MIKDAPQNMEYLPHYSGDVLFPWKLHEMLEDAEKQGFTTVVSWLPDDEKSGGQRRSSFKVHDKETFVSLILPRYFDQTKYKSFQRQLNMWGFERHSMRGSLKGGYTHEYFVRGKPALCSHMSRLKKTRQPNDRASCLGANGKNTPAFINIVIPPRISSGNGLQGKYKVVKMKIQDGGCLDLPGGSEISARTTTPLHEASATSSASSVVSWEEDSEMSVDGTDGAKHPGFTSQEGNDLVVEGCASFAGDTEGAIASAGFTSTAGLGNGLLDTMEPGDDQVEFEGMRFFAVPDINSNNSFEL